MIHLAAIVIPNHVIAENHVALLCEIHAARRDRAGLGILKPAVGPVPVRGENRGEAPVLASRAVEISRHEKAGIALEEYLLDRISITLDSLENLRLQRSLLGHRPEPCGDENLLAD